MVTESLRAGRPAQDARKGPTRPATDHHGVHPTSFAPWHRRHPAAFVVLMVTTIVLVVLALGAGLLLGLGVLFVHALSDPVPADRHDAVGVRQRVAIYGETLDRGWDVRGLLCTRLAEADPADRWFPPAPRTPGVVTIDGDDATVVVSSSNPPAAAATVTTLRFRYESGVWRYCGVS